MTRPGTYDNRARVLNSTIPAGFFGRPLTSAECRALRLLGIRCSTRWIVVRQVTDIDDLGVLFRPAPGGGYNTCRIYVTTAEGFRRQLLLERRQRIADTFAEWSQYRLALVRVTP